MQILIDIPDAPIGDYLDLLYKIDGMAASEGLFDDNVKSQRTLALKVILDIFEGILKGTPQPNQWIVNVDRWGNIVTTIDGYKYSDKDNYCPNCGTRMVEPQ